MIAPYPVDHDPAGALLADLFPERPKTGEGELAAALLEEGSGRELDFGRLVGRWLALRDRIFEGAETLQSLHHLADTGAPPLDGQFGPGFGAAAVTLPMAGRLAGHPRNLVSGTFHLARLLDPHPIGDYAAVAVAVTAACFLSGRRDFVPDVLDVLIANEAPVALIEEARRVPVWRRDAERRQADRPAEIVAQIGQLLWVLRHEPIEERALATLVPGGPLLVRLGRALVRLRERVSEAG